MMGKVKNNVIKVMSIIVILIIMGIPILAGMSACVQRVSAAEGTTKQYVLDNAGIFTESEREKLQTACEQASKNCGTDIVVLTMTQGLDDDAMDNYVRSIIESQYGYNGTGSNADAVVYAIDMKSRADRIVTSGNAKTDPGFTQDKLNSIRQNAEKQLKNSDYYQGCVKYIAGVQQIMNHSLTYRLTLYLPIKIATALAIAVIAVLVMMYHAKSRMTVNGSTYTRDHQYQIVGQEDQYINTTVVTRHIQKNNDGNGGGGGGNSGSSGGHF